LKRTEPFLLSKRRFEPGAQELQELHLGHRLSCAAIAQLLAKDKSWVARRLLLFDTLDDEMIALIREGVVSAWSAQRILVPLARANGEHARCLAAGLKKQSISTRKLSVFFDHYKRSNRKTRQNMVSDPHLFLKAYESGRDDQNAHCLQQGPEGRWLKDIRIVNQILSRLIKAVPEVLYRDQDTLERRRFLTAYADAAGSMQALSETIERSGHAQQPKTADNFNAAPGRLQDPAYQPPGASVSQRSAPCH
jgi:hypothetical protein